MKRPRIRILPEIQAEIEPILKLKNIGLTALINDLLRKWIRGQKAGHYKNSGGLNENKI